MSGLGVPSERAVARVPPPSLAAEAPPPLGGESLVPAEDGQHPRSGPFRETDMEDASSLVGREHLIQAVANVAGRADVRLLDDVEVKRATAGVEGFLSVVLRVKVSYRTGDDAEPRSKSLIVKCLPRDEFQLDIVRQTNVFAREGIFYDRALPLMKEAAAGKLDVPIPSCYHAAYDGAGDVLCLEDLSEMGFSTPGRRIMNEGLDWEHASIIAKKLGVLHALGFAAERRLPPGKANWVDAFPVFGEEPLFYVPKPGDPPVPFKGVADTGNVIVVEVARQMSGLAREAADCGKLQRIIERFWPIVCERARPDRRRGRNVLCHGDCWVNNVMFRYEVDGRGSRKPVDLKFIDLQIAKYLHPCIDLLCFIHLSTRKNFREKYYDRVIVEYYNSLHECMMTLDCGPPPFSLEEFAADVKDEYKPFGVYFGAVYTPCMLLEDDFVPENADDMTPEKYEELMNSGNVSAIRKRLASDPAYTSHVKDVVQEFVDMVFPNGSLESSPFME